MCIEYWLIACSKLAQENAVRLTDSQSHMTEAVDWDKANKNQLRS